MKRTRTHQPSVKVSSHVGRLGPAQTRCFSFLPCRRFRCIMHPFREKLTLQKALVTIAVIWALALLIMSTMKC